MEWTLGDGSAPTHTVIPGDFDPMPGETGIPEDAACIARDSSVASNPQPANVNGYPIKAYFRTNPDLTGLETFQGETMQDNAGTITVDYDTGDALGIDCDPNNLLWLRVTIGADVWVYTDGRCADGSNYGSSGNDSWTKLDSTGAFAEYYADPPPTNGILGGFNIDTLGALLTTQPPTFDYTPGLWHYTSQTGWELAASLSVTYGNGLFVAVAFSGTGNRVMTSPDGITWTVRQSAADNMWNCVAYGNGLFVAVSADGTGNRVMTAP